MARLDTAIDFDKRIKLCRGCVAWLSFESFYPQKGKKSGLSGRCKTCTSRSESSLRASRISKGICVDCAKPRLPHSNEYCAFHLVRRLIKSATGKVDKETVSLMLERLETQNYKCAYTGDDLVLGLNASLDHRLPVSRFPAHKSDLSNLEWVTLQVNLAKRDLTFEEFKELCSKVLSPCLSSCRVGNLYFVRKYEASCGVEATETASSLGRV